MEDVAGDLTVGRSLTIPSSELVWRFSRSSGPGGQSVNTTDSRVALSWLPRSSGVVSDSQRARLTARLDLDSDGQVTVVASEHRSQWQNRRAARLRLADLIAAALAPPRRRRRPTRPTRSSVERRLSGKRHRSELKRRRARPTDPT